MGWSNAESGCLVHTHLKCRRICPQRNGGSPKELFCLSLSVCLSLSLSVCLSQKCKSKNLKATDLSHEKENPNLHQNQPVMHPKRSLKRRKHFMQWTHRMKNENSNCIRTNWKQKPNCEQKTIISNSLSISLSLSLHLSQKTISNFSCNGAVAWKMRTSIAHKDNLKLSVRWSYRIKNENPDWIRTPLLIFGTHWGLIA